MNTEDAQADGGFSLSCPTPKLDHETVLLAHGGGGRLMNQLIETVIRPAFRNEQLDARHDGAVLEIGGQRLAFTTDSYVVQPLFFPGGDIGRLAVHGTVNDLAMCGARPRYLSAGLIIEEGLPMETLAKIVDSMRSAAADSGVTFVTGDTKVVERGKGDGVFINTAGIGVIENEVEIGPHRVQPGDVILLSGDVGRHGIAIMAQREGLRFESEIESDCADVSGLVLELLAAGAEIHCLRDCTRGGLGSALIEIAESSGHGIQLRENAVPVREDVGGACEILGLDPLYIANEGRFIVVAPEDYLNTIRAIMQEHALGEGACHIGEVIADASALVRIESAVGVGRVMSMFSGEQLPRIC